MGARTVAVGLGYEGRDVDAFVRDIIAMGMATLVDVRLNPISREPGFSRRRLSEVLAEHGIGYVHLPQLGNPKWNRAGFAAGTRAGASPDCRRRRRCRGRQRTSPPAGASAAPTWPRRRRAR